MSLVVEQGQKETRTTWINSQSVQRQIQGMPGGECDSAQGEKAITTAIETKETQF